MTATNQKGGITRRRFFERGAGALATAGILAGVGVAKDVSGSDENVNVARTDSVPMTGKIALEENFVLPEAADSYHIQPTPEFELQMRDMASRRIADMDRGGVELCILSHVGPGVQAIPNISEAITTSRRWNDYLAENITKKPKRLKGFATLPMQDPQAAALRIDALRQGTRFLWRAGFWIFTGWGCSGVALP